MADQRLALIESHVFLAHAVEIIIGRIVFADMVEAEGKILPLAQAPHRRAMAARLGAAGKLAARHIRAQGLFGFALDADAIENAGI